MAFSDYIVYVDESGDHSLTSIDPSYPVFVLAFCIFHRESYCDAIVPAMQRLKFRHFGRDLVVFHERDIRKSQADFRFLYDRQAREGFMDETGAFVEAAEFTVVAAVIDKPRLLERYAQPDSPYTIALTFCLERTYAFLHERNAANATTVICVEQRGKAEDNELELDFRRIIQGENRWGQLPFDIRFASKQVNSTGLQLADLVARPIGRRVMNREQPNRAYDIIRPKIRTSPDGEVRGWGIKSFP